MPGRCRWPSSRTGTPLLRAGQSRRDHTDYECDERLVGEQRCHDCQRPCRRVDYGGPYPHCGDTVTITELTEPPMA